MNRRAENQVWRAERQIKRTDCRVRKEEEEEEGEDNAGKRQALIYTKVQIIDNIAMYPQLTQISRMPWAC